jgi:hypothetical protein
MLLSSIKLFCFNKTFVLVKETPGTMTTELSDDRNASIAFES